MNQVICNNLAPVLITVYDRFDCLQNSIASLLTNKLCSQTELYIVSDHAYSKDREEIVSKIREYIISIKGFKKVEGIFWDYNKGSFDSSQDAIRYLFDKYDRLIAFEDDILVSNQFLDYMNEALEFYKDDLRIISIASHRNHKDVVPKNYPYEVFLLKMFSPWGVGIWKDRFESIDWSLEGMQDFLNDKKQIKAFNSISTHALPILLHMLENDKKYSDIMIHYNMFKKKKYTLFPIKPLSVNRGCDGRGEHCVADEELQNQPLTMDFLPKLTKDIQYDLELGKKHAKAFWSFRRDLLNPFLQKIHLYKPLKYLRDKFKQKQFSNAKAKD